MIALRRVGTKVEKLIPGLGIVHAPGRDSQIQMMTELDGGAYQRSVAAIVGKPYDETLIDLQLVSRPAPQIAHSRVARPVVPAALENWSASTVEK